MGLNVIPGDNLELTPGEKRVLNKLVSLYKETGDHECYLYVQPRIKGKNPDFILIDVYKGICIIEVKDWSFNFIESIDNFHAVNFKGERLENPVVQANTYYNFAQKRLSCEPSLIGEGGSLMINLYSRVIFTNMSSEEIDRLMPSLHQPPTECMGSDQLRKLSLNTLFSTDSYFLNDHLVSLTRSVFFPEIRVRSVQSQLWPYFRKDTLDSPLIKTLDGQQEKFARKIPYGHYMISGIPGSGKTVILLSRAIHLIKENPDWNIRILTYNRSLMEKIKARVNELGQDLELMGINYKNITVSTFHSLAKQFASMSPPAGKNDLYWKETLPYDAINNAEPMFDAILIDEYQDFEECWIKLCLKVCKKHEYLGNETENLFLAGDRLQSIYNSKTHSWKSLGVNIQGRSKLLKTSYRSGSRHITLALDYLMRDEVLRKEVDLFYEGQDGIVCNYKTDNSVDFIKGGMTTVNDYLRNLFSNENYNPEDVLMLVRHVNGPNNKDVIYGQIDEDLRANCVSTKKFEPHKMNINTYHSSKGLECKVCILLNIDEVKDKKLVYVGMTRASERLCIHSFSPEGGDVFNQLSSCYESMNLPVENDILDHYDPVILSDGQNGPSVEEIRMKYPNAYKVWKERDVLELIQLYRAGKSIGELSICLGRNEGGIRARLRKLGLIGGDISGPAERPAKISKGPVSVKASRGPDSVKASGDPDSVKASGDPVSAKASRGPDSVKASDDPVSAKASRGPDSVKASDDPVSVKKYDSSGEHVDVVKNIQPGPKSPVHMPSISSDPEVTGSSTDPLDVSGSPDHSPDHNISEINEIAITDKKGGIKAKFRKLTSFFNR